MMMKVFLGHLTLKVQVMCLALQLSYKIIKGKVIIVRYPTQIYKPIKTVILLFTIHF